MIKASISVIAAVRGRVGMLGTMLTSLFEMAEHPYAVELVLRCDNDDPEMIAYLSTLPHRFIVGPRLAGYASLPGFNNEAARLSHADVVLVVNDDVEFQSFGWDTALVAHAATYPDGIFVLGIDTENAKNFVFPCVSRTQINLLGGVFEERVVYPDILLRDVLQPFGRAIRVHDVRIAHKWQGRSQDQERALARTHSSEHQALYAQCVDEGRAKVAAVLGVPA